MNGTDSYIPPIPECNDPLCVTCCAVVSNSALSSIIGCQAIKLGTTQKGQP